MTSKTNFQRSLLSSRNSSMTAEMSEFLIITMEEITSSDISQLTISITIWKRLMEQGTSHIFLVTTTECKSIMLTFTQAITPHNTDQLTAMVVTFIGMTSNAAHFQPKLLTMVKSPESLKIPSTFKNLQENHLFTLPHVPTSRHLPDTDILV